MARLPSLDLEIVLLDERHDRANFTCGVESLDRYFRTQASQDMRRKANAAFVLSERKEPARIFGYYTLCAMAIAQGDVPASVDTRDELGYDGEGGSSALPVSRLS